MEDSPPIQDAETTEDTGPVEPITPAPEPVAEPVVAAPKRAVKPVAKASKPAAKSGAPARKTGAKRGAPASKPVVKPVAPAPEPVAEPVDATLEPVEPTEEAATRSAATVTEQASGTVEAVAGETGEAEEGAAGLQPAPRIESGCHLDRDVLLTSLETIQNYLQHTDVEQQTDEAFLKRLGDMVNVLGADMGNLRAYCERSQEQLMSIRSPIKDITDKIFKTITAAESEEEHGKIYIFISTAIYKQFTNRYL